MKSLAAFFRRIADLCDSPKLREDRSYLEFIDRLTREHHESMESARIRRDIERVRDNVRSIR